MADQETELTSMFTSNSNSTSTSASPKDDSYCYEVFINHRGPDVKNTFASHLYRRLLQRGLRVFLDKPELEEGLNFTLQIQRAIRTASVHVAIFSPRYAESKWCLDELLQMFESEASIIPVFYHVKPAQLRWTQDKGGVYSEDLRKLEEKKTYDTQTHEEKPRHDPTTIQKWRGALSRVAEISGFELDANNTDEGEQLDKIVERVVKKVKKRGLDEAAKDSENTVLLEQQQRGKFEVLLRWSGKLQALCESIGQLLGQVSRSASCSARCSAGCSASCLDFPDEVREIAPMGRPYVDFPDGVWEFRSRATAHPIWWQCFFVLFMNMVVVYVLGS
jgi:hypothetical protein